MMLTVLPLIDEPDFTALFVVNTPMNDGMPDAGGGGLLPPVADQGLPRLELQSGTGIVEAQ
jgi:hypothetical protein